ncbi:MAG TPA: hypothetical protein VJT78_03525 [Candidatus Dormibacteraeota bacterium]|nr:hypothetical protein [Candidatus Dormibacteraeota bacterium]
MATVVRYGPGEDAKDFTPGDFVLAHRHHVIARLISLAQKRRFHGRDVVFAHWSHAAVVVAPNGDLVEAESMGVVRSPISKYHESEYHLIRLGPDFIEAGRSRTVAYAEGQVGQGFGYLAIVGAMLYLLFGWHLRLVRRNHEICSGLVVRALQAGGQLRELDPVLTLPADLAKRFGARP